MYINILVAQQTKVYIYKNLNEVIKNKRRYMVQHMCRTKQIYPHQ